MIRWPGRIPAGRVSDQVGITMDLDRVDRGGDRQPVPASYEGVDLFPILEGRAPAVERTMFWRTGHRQPDAAAMPQRRLEGDGRLQSRDGVQPARRTSASGTTSRAAAGARPATAADARGVGAEVDADGAAVAK